MSVHKLRYDPLIDHQKILGATFVNHLNGSEHAVITDGKRFISKHRLVMDYGTGNFLAARNIFKMMKKLRLTSITEFFDYRPEEIADMKTIGVTGLYVLICIGRARGVDIAQWYAKGKEKDDLTTFTTLKLHARKEHEKPRTDKERKHAALHAAGSHMLKTKSAHAKRLADTA